MEVKAKEIKETEIKENKEPPVKENKEPPVKETKKEGKKETPVKETKKEDKKQQAKGGKQPEKEKPVDVSRLEIRVGKIVDVKKHETADTLYVEQIDLGEPKPRTVVSGLVNFVPIEQMQNRMVVCVCNLKPSKLRGVTSEAMVLAASNADHTKVELLDPEPSSKIGERVTFDGFPGEHDEQLNPKQKVWETIQPDFETTDDCTAVWKGIPFKTSAGILKVKSIAKGTIK